MLTNKNAVIYGAGGSLGGAVAEVLAAAGAKVFLTGRNRKSVQKTADKIIEKGGQADVQQVDVLDETAVKNHLDYVLETGGKVDISFNAVGIDVLQNIPLIDMQLEDFVNPVTFAMQTHFSTARAAARIMIQQKSGVILTLTATPGGIAYPFTGGFAPTCCAIESFSKNLASELGIYGVRVVNIRSGGSPDSKVFKDAIESNPDQMEIVLKKLKDDTMLKTLPSMADIANVALFLSSDMAGKITGVTIDVTAGTTSALNYRVSL